MARLTAGVIALSLPATVGYTLSRAPARTPMLRTVSTQTVTRTVTRTIESSYWHRRYRRRTRQLQVARRTTSRLHRTLLQQPTVMEAIGLACVVYGNCQTLWRRARCESRLNPNAHNPSGASGLFQFFPSTWRTTPYGSFSIWSPLASALAAGWMIHAGRGGEWACQ